MKFEEQFPSLMKKSSGKNYKIPQYYIHLLEEGGEDDCSNNAKSIEYVDYVLIESVKEHCVDKQRVKDVLHQFFPNAGTINQIYSQDSLCDQILSELGIK